MSQQQQLIGGMWVDAERGGRWDVVDPGTEEIVASVPFGDAADTNRAIDAAQAAFPAWRARTAYDRAAILMRAAELMRTRSETLGEITVRESGKSPVICSSSSPRRASASRGTPSLRGWRPSGCSCSTSRSAWLA